MNTRTAEAPTQKHAVWIWGLLGAAALLYLVTLRAGHRAGDFAMFLMHAQNLVTGQPYAETAFLWNPLSPSVGTVGYPAGAPLLYAPIVALLSLNFPALKAVGIFCFLGALAALSTLIRRVLPLGWTMAWVGLVAAMPYFWDIKDNVLSDLPALLWIALALAGTVSLRNSDDPDSISRGAWVGVAMGLAVASRTAAIPIVPAFVLSGMLARRSWIPGRAVWAGLVAFVVVFAGCTIAFPIEADGGDSYLALLIETASSPGLLIAAVIENVKYYLLAVLVYIVFGNGYVGVLSMAVAGLVLLAAGLGFWHRARANGGRVVELFTVFYLVLIMLWPFRMPSYLVPLLPLLLYYAAVGLHASAPERYRPALGLAAAGVILASFAGMYTTMNLRALDQNVGTPAAFAVYSEIESRVGPDEVVVVRVPRTFALFTDRTSTAPLLPDDGRDRFSERETALVFEHFESIGADYVVTGPKGEDYHEEVLPLWYLVQDAPERFEEVYGNEEFVLYRIVEIRDDLRPEAAPLAEETVIP